MSINATQSVFLLRSLTDGFRANDVRVLFSVSGTNSVTVGKHREISAVNERVAGG